MRILITGAAGMVGRKLIARLAKDGTLRGRKIAALDLHDIVPPQAPGMDGVSVTLHTGDLAEAGATEGLVASRPDVVFHLAGIVSGEAEANFELGYRVNLDGTRALFDAIRLAGFAPRLVFTSSIAVFGAPFPDVIPDEFHPTPLTSYGTQKQMAKRCWPTIPGAASSTASASGCRPSACGRASRTRRHRASSPASSASR